MDRHGWDERYNGRDPAFTAQPNPLVVEEVRDLAPGRALDLGCGEGRHSVWLAARGWQVVGVDFSPVGLGRAQARARDEGVAAAFVVADVATLRLPPGGFDLVLAAFFHPQDNYAALAAAVATGGSLLQVSYDITNLTEGTGGPSDPRFLMQTPQIAAELGALGLRVVRADTVRLRVATADGEEADVVDAVVRAVKEEAGS